MLEKTKISCREVIRLITEENLSQSDACDQAGIGMVSVVRYCKAEGIEVPRAKPGRKRGSGKSYPRVIDTTDYKVNQVLDKQETLFKVAMIERLLAEVKESLR